MTRHQKALAWLIKHEGEHEQPPGSNTGLFVISCQRATWLAGTRWPWCVAAVLKAWKEAGIVSPYLGAGAYAFLDWYRDKLPRWVVRLEHAKPGAAVVFNVGAGHMAMLARPYKETAPNVVTVGGNESDSVRIVTRHVSVVRGVVDPPEQVVTHLPKAKPPVFEVVTSASGHAKLVYASGAKAVGRKIPQLLNKYGGVTIRRRKRG